MLKEYRRTPYLLSAIRRDAERAEAGRFIFLEMPCPAELLPAQDKSMRAMNISKMIFRTPAIFGFRCRYIAFSIDRRFSALLQMMVVDAITIAAKHDVNNMRAVEFR